MSPRPRKLSAREARPHTRTASFRTALAARRAGSEAGVSMIELVIAILLFFIVIMGIMPLFLRSTIANAMGRDMTLLSNQSKSTAERMYQIPFNSPAMTIPDGSTEVVVTEYWDDATDSYTTVAPTTGVTPRFTRTTTLRQYGLSDLADGTLDDPLDGSVDPTTVQLKEIEVSVVSGDLGPIRGRRILFRTLKPF